MSECRTCCPVDVLVPGDLDYETTFYATQGFSFVEDCPPGYYCKPGQFPVLIDIPISAIPPVIIFNNGGGGGSGGRATLQGCTSVIHGTIPGNATEAQIAAIVESMQEQWAAQQAACDAKGLATLRPRQITLPSTCVGITYDIGSIPFTGTGPYVFQQTGALPPGLVFSQLNGTTIEISGTATTPGDYVFSVFVGTTGVDYHLSVVGITNTPTSATQNSPYSFQFTAAGGTAPYTFAIVSGSLPVGLSMSSSGLITGTPTALGTVNFQVSITDSST